MKAIIGALSVMMMLASLGTLEAKSSGGEAGRFLSYGAGGRPLAMGGAFYGLADDATAAYWNPAGLAGLQRKELVAMYAQLYADTNLGFLAYAHPMAAKGTVGFMYNQLISDGFEKVTIQTDNQGNITGLQTIGTFSDEQRALGMAWGKPIAERFDLGVSSKFLTRKLDTSVDSHIGMDITTIIRAFPRYQIGLGLHNVLAMKSGDTDDTLPLTLRVGNNYKLIRDKLSLGLDFENSQRSGLSWRFGGEYWVLSWIAFRFGIQGDPGSTGGAREMNFGAGLHYQNFSLDLANAVHDLGLTTRFSASWRFGGSIKVSQESKIRRSVQLGFDAFRSGNFLIALQRLNQALDAQPGNKMLQGMVERLQQVVAVYPQALGESEVMTYVRKGVAQYISGADQKASVNALRYAFNKNIQDEKVLGLLNLVEKDAQVPELTRKIEGPQIFTWIDQKVFDARSSFHDGKYDIVIRRCQDILDLEPTNTTALEIMGSAFFMMDQKDKATALWKRVLEVDPNNKTVRPFLESLEK
ncbi:MAG: PorV/PorQ family protein [Elusimicrobia bacterium]|nr:PorV/PorQ family protein [Elusimicrobiota bacterium]